LILCLKVASFFGFSGIENDAIVIFSKYLSPDCSQPIEISDDLRAQTIGRICHEDGTVDPSCFERCQQDVFGRMETRWVDCSGVMSCNCSGVNELWLLRC